MADGTQFDTDKSSSIAKKVFSYKLLDAAAAVDAGVWVDARLFDKATLHIFGTFVGTVKICISNEITPAADGLEFGSDITVPTILSITTLPVRWIKVKVSAYTSGAINAYLHAKQV